ncbi:MAG: ATP-binding protein [Polyangiaceae bacterium]|jgi:signal transduction histidine kinase
MAALSLAPRLPEARIQDLVHTTRWIPAGTLVPEVVRLLEEAPDLDSLVVLDTGGAIATIRRAHLFGQLHGRYGYALYERAAICQLAENDPLIVDANERPVDVIATAVGRDARRIYDDIVVVENGRYFGSVSMRLLMAHGKDLLVSSLADRSLLEERNRKLDQLHHMQREFVATMTHELRSPINTIMGIARLFADDGDLSAERREDAELLLSRGHDLLGIVNNLLDMHKLEAAQMVPVLEEVDLRALLAEALEAARFLLQGKPIQLELGLGDLPATVVTDSVLLRRILTNLLSNAVKFTDRGTVRLAAHRDERGLCIQVADTGVGIRSEDVGRLFRKFAQLETGKLHRHGGTGLGLVIVKQIAELLGGTVSVEGTLGGGTTFTARFDGTPPHASVAPRRSLS